MILCVTTQVITVLNGVIHYLLGYLLSFRELPAKVNKARDLRVLQVQVDKRVWFEVKLQGAQGNHEANVFQENVHLGIKVGTNIMVTEVPGQEGAEDNVAEKKKVKESIDAN
ncbi:hypothetical protein Tco_0098926 [Tanacetum coccineum]